jgi:hypothetical protein
LGAAGRRREDGQDVSPARTIHERAVTMEFAAKRRRVEDGGFNAWITVSMRAPVDCAAYPIQQLHPFLLPLLTLA